MKFWQFKALCSADRGDRLIVTGGRNEGKTIEFSYTSNSKVVGDLDNGEEIQVAYANVEFIDSEGQPRYELVTDMTGREIFPETILCYSVTENRLHALEIGRVLSISDTGYVKIKVLVHNGEKIDETHWRSERTIQDPDKTLKLPADVTTVMMWIMKDFEGLKPAPQ